MSAAPIAPTNQPTRVGRLLDLVRRLIEYGKELATSLQQRSPATDLASVQRGFGTSDIALILASITRGLLRASALEAKIVRNAARLEADPGPPGAPAPRKPRAARRPAAPQSDTAQPSLALLPTPKQIAAAVRRRPIGAVIIDICRDLGITPRHPLWRDVQLAVIRYGGSLVTLANDLSRRVFQMLVQSWPAVPPPPSPAPACTGPPTAEA